MDLRLVWCELRPYQVKRCIEYTVFIVSCSLVPRRPFSAVAFGRLLRRVYCGLRVVKRVVAASVQRGQLAEPLNESRNSPLSGASLSDSLFIFHFTFFVFFFHCSFSFSASSSFTLLSSNASHCSILSFLHTLVLLLCITLILTLPFLLGLFLSPFTFLGL